MPNRVIQRNFEYHDPKNERNFEYNEQNNELEIISDKTYELVFSHRDLVKVLDRAKKMGFSVEDIVETHKSGGKGHIRLENERKHGYARIERADGTFNFYVPITSLS